MTLQRYDLKEWWSKVTKSPYEKFIPWSGISTGDSRGLDPKLNDQVIFQMLNVDEIYGRNLSTLDEIDRYDFMRPNVGNDLKLSLKFINSNRCKRLAIVEDTYAKYHNDLNVALYGNEEEFNVAHGDPDVWGYSFYYTKETCETDDRRHEWSDIVILILTRSGGPDFRTCNYLSPLRWTSMYKRLDRIHGQSGFHFCQSSEGSNFILGYRDIEFYKHIQHQFFVHKKLYEIFSIFF